MNNLYINQPIDIIGAVIIGIAMLIVIGRVIRPFWALCKARSNSDQKPNGEEGCKSGKCSRCSGCH